MKKIQKKIFKNGLKVAIAPMPFSQAVATNIFIGAGSRYEPKELSGISHFLEHLVFKGTKNRKSHKEISEDVEGKGGVLNAWTDIDHTGFWNKMPAKYLEESLDVAFDLVFNPLLRDKDIKKEKGVILEEINRKEDLPEWQIWELFQQVMWPNEKLGQYPLGTKESVRKIQQEDFLRYVESLYQPNNMVIVVAGNVDRGAVFKKTEKLLKNLSKKREIKKKRFFLEKVKNKKISLGPRVLLQRKETEQVHICLGTEGFPFGHPYQFAIGILSVIVGQGMSSRLFTRIREEKGWAYSIHSSQRSFQDTGYFVVYGGIKTSKIKETLKLILSEFRNLKDKKVSSKELRKAKEFICGNFLLSMDEPDNVASFLGTQELLCPKVYTPKEYIAQINKVQAEDILKTANEIFSPSKLHLALIGSFKNKQEFEKLLQF